MPPVAVPPGSGLGAGAAAAVVWAGASSAFFSWARAQPPSARAQPTTNATALTTMRRPTAFPQPFVDDVRSVMRPPLAGPRPALSGSSLKKQKAPFPAPLPHHDVLVVLQRNGEQHPCRRAGESQVMWRQ